MLKILQVRLQQCVNCELPDVQAGFRKESNQRSNCQHPLDHQKSKRIPENHLLLLYWLRQSLWLCRSQQTVENSSINGNTRPPDLPPKKSICRSRSSRIGHGTIDWFQIGKGVCQGCILSPCLFNLDAEYIMRNAGLEEVQAGIKIAGRNINNLRYTDDITLMAESDEELNSLFMKGKKGSEKAGLQFSIKKLRSWHLIPSLHGK